MARNDSSSNGKKFQFQMGWGGIAAIFFSTVCVLLWIFVLGFWAGQRITEKKYAQGAFLQQAQPITPETAPPSAAGPASPQEPRQAEDTRTAAPASAVPLEQVATTPTDQLAQEQPIRPEAAESIKPVIKPELKPEIKPAPKPAQSVVEERHEAAAPKPAAEKPKAAVTPPAPATKETKPAPGHETAKKEVKPSTQANDVAKVEEKIKKLEEKKAGTLHSEPAKPAPAVKTEAKPVSSGSYYALQVAAFKDKAQAETELKKFESKGLKGKIRTVDLGPEKGTWTRVYIGRYETAEKAKAAQGELASHGYSKPSYVVMLQD